MMALFKNRALYILLALGLGIFAGLLKWTVFLSTATLLTTLFVSLLKLISIPLIFLAIVSTITRMESMREFRQLGGQVFKYTLLTTIIAASIGLILFLVLNPAHQNMTALITSVESATLPQGSYWDYILENIPSNLITPFSEGNVIAVLLLALMMSFAILVLPATQKNLLSDVFGSLFAALLEIAKTIVRFIPIAIWAFVTEFVADLDTLQSLTTLGVYLICVLLANVIQALIVLPALLKYKGLSPVAIFRGMAPALNVAFWSKSSAATLPVTMQCAKERLGVREKIAGFSLPLCTAINMNGCAGFIIITVMFVAMSNGFDFSLVEMLAWIFIATLAAIGNAGVPMGCYFLSLALLSTMNVPLTLMFVILPFYAFIDMLETAINVWSDACVTCIVDAENKA
ncbi:MAG TPA: dicarboxylate/amino acid:cation symporter [Gammaproteobacteria bacterium]|nr:dicarboxylate/amino acid:cation symporter [Gammaproteobacteria bacterium]